MIINSPAKATITIVAQHIGTHKQKHYKTAYNFGKSVICNKQEIRQKAKEGRICKRTSTTLDTNDFV